MLRTPRTRSVAVPASHPFSCFSLFPVQWQYGASGFRLLNIPAKIELPARESDYAIEARLYLRRQIPSHDQSLGFPPNKIERLHEVSLFQIVGIAGIDGGGGGGWGQPDASCGGLGGGSWGVARRSPTCWRHIA